MSTVIARHRQSLLVAAGSLLVLAIVAGPILLRGPFFWDWSNHLFIVDRDTESIAATGWPTYFLHSAATGLFYPFLLFYGGTLYAMTGYLGWLLGSALAAFKFIQLAAAVAAFGGTFWLSRLAGLSRTLAFLPSAALVSSAYWLSNVYGRAAVPEFVATSCIPLVLASTVAMIVHPSPPRRYALCIYVGVIGIAGSHNITLLWSGSLAVVALAVWLLLGGRAAVHRGRLVAVLAAAITGLLTTSWHLMPAATWSGQTGINKTDQIDGDWTGFLNTPEVVLNWARVVPTESGTPQLFVQAPTLILASSLILFIVGYSRMSRNVRAMGLVGLVLVASLGLLIMARWPWPLIPTIFKLIQFQYRLQFYMTFGVLLLLIAGLRGTAARMSESRTARGREGRTRRICGLALVVAAATVGIGLGQGGLQAWSATSYPRVTATDLAPGTLPETWRSSFDYRLHPDNPFRPILVPCSFDPGSVVEGVAVLPSRPSAGYCASNAVYSPLIRGTGGLEVVGANAHGMAVLRIPATIRANAGIASSPSGIVTAGQAITGFAILVFGMLVLFWRRVTTAEFALPHRR